MTTQTRTRLFKKMRDGVAHVGFVRAQRFYPVDGQVTEGDEPLVHQEGLPGTPTESGWYIASLEDGTRVHCRRSFPI